LGGCATGLLITDTAAPPIRVTRDVDAIVQVVSRGDYLMSHDIEDIVAVLDGRPEILHEVSQADPDLVRELSKRFRSLLQQSRFIDAVSGHMPAGETSHPRVSLILKTIKEIAKLQ
jgi:hypothetical protein